ncbi:type IV pilus modification protein PilV [Shewanella sp. 10N.286.52.B9]|uniref:type IV pilus modification protein PilV n=1 Tax=Shewanella sp. 10N.286.52.B9 TaxID=1880837 RepID=UPI000C81982E|nr:type IV pilus modification protein PilV [Shewanella sp. 10N.286.52.B9]PMG43199.1 type IV pilus modification protein PilV [Shewanella sp. 10N.286.52.B9]
MPVKRNGFSLIEVMVSLVILTVGLIGIFNLHIVAKRGSFESFQQTQASYYANDIINRMRLNASELVAYGSATGTKYTGTSLTAPSKSCTGATLCTPGELQLWDVYEWQASFIGESEKESGSNVGGLPSVESCIFVKPQEVVVVITWKGVRKSSGFEEGYSDEVKGCGNKTNKKRIFEVKTAIF